MKLHLFLLIAILLIASACSPARSADIAPSQATPPAPQQVTEAPALVFSLTGGEIGFCDELSVDSLGGYVLRRSCAEPAALSGSLDPPDLALLTGWRQNLTGFQLDLAGSPGGPENLAAALSFAGQGSEAADAAQQQLIFDWANSVLIRIRPQPVTPPPPSTPVAIGPEGLCPEISRPAVLVIDFERPGGLILIDPDSGANCNFQLNQPPYGRIATAAGNIFYALYDPQAKTVTVWQLSPGGQQTPLPFTSVAMAEFGPYNFTVSADGSKIAWAQAVIQAGDPSLYRNDVWVANLDGTAQVKLLDQVTQTRRYAEPVRFSSDQSTLYYALQPDGLSGALFSFPGRYDSLYRAAAAGGESSLLFACPEGQPLCIGDIAADGNVLAYVQPGQGIVLLDGQGRQLHTISPPAADFIGSPLFGPTGSLTFVSATLTQSGSEALPQPDPGVIHWVAPPYTGEIVTLWRDNNVTTIWEWLDENRLLYGRLDDAANIGTAVVTVAGQSSQLSTNFALAILN